MAHESAARCVQLEAQFLGESDQMRGISALVFGDAEYGELLAFEMLTVKPDRDAAVVLGVAITAKGMEVIAQDGFYRWQRQS